MSKLWSALGLMSGTSLDGIDIALIKTDGGVIVHRGPSRTYPYEQDQREMLNEALRESVSLQNRNARPGSLASIEWAITDWHALAVESFCEEFGLTDSEIDVIGFHGQTVLHRPERRLTVQLGDGALLAGRTGRPVVYDLRAADVAAGGQGAPLVPIYHRALAAAIDARPLAFVNIGGVANLTWIGAQGEVLAFDTGPGNALLDDWALRHTGQPTDIDGRFASRGKVDEAALAQFLGDSYFEERAPKSLDRNSFSGLSLADLSPEDGAATLTAFTARAIARARDLVPEEPKLWLISGGGRKNSAIMRALAALLPDVRPVESFGLDGDALEAEAWAYLAVRSFLGLPISFPGTTGAPEPMTGGILCKSLQGTAREPMARR